MKLDGNSPWMNATLPNAETVERFQSIRVLTQQVLSEIDSRSAESLRFLGVPRQAVPVRPRI